MANGGRIMKIVVAGAGKGEVLCRELVFDDYEITLIELTRSVSTA